MRIGSLEIKIKERLTWIKENIPEDSWKFWASHVGGGSYGGGTIWYVSFKNDEYAMAFKLRWL